MPLKRLRKAGDVTHDQRSGADEDFSTTTEPTSRKASVTVWRCVMRFIPDCCGDADCKGGA